MMSPAPYVLLLLPCLGFANVIQPTTPPVGCRHYDGTIYPPGAHFQPVPCEHCVCPDEGGQTYCAIMDCMMPQCVDAVRKPDQCCATCPNGPNCHLGGKIIPAGKDFEEGEKVCRCPTPEMGFGLGPSDIQAICSLKAPDEVTTQHMGPR